MQPLPALFIVFNAASGHEDAARASQRLCARLDAAQQVHTLYLVPQGGDLARSTQAAVKAAQAAGGLLVAAGGDGTLNQVAQAAWKAGLPMALLPQGTFNYFARSHGVPDEWEAAIDALLAAQPRAVQIGLVNERIFLVNASVGLYPRLLQNRERAKRHLGRHRIVAMASGLWTLLRGGGRLDLQLQSDSATRRLRLRTLFVGNNALQLEALGLPQAHAVQHGQLAAIGLHPVSAWRTLWLVLRGAMGRLEGVEGVEVFAFRQLRIAPVRWLRWWKVAIDGEVVRLRAPLVFQPAPRPLQLWLPAPRQSGLDAAQDSARATD